MTEEQFQLLANASTILMLLGMISALLRRSKLAGILVFSGLALPVTAVIIVEHGSQFGWAVSQLVSDAREAGQNGSALASVRSTFNEHWRQLPEGYRFAATVIAFLSFLILLLLSAVLILRWVARPFLGATAADSMGASLAADGIRFILGGFLVRLVRWMTQSITGRN